LDFPRRENGQEDLCGICCQPNTFGISGRNSRVPFLTPKSPFEHTPTK
jgi:hypothetical protein